VAITFDDGYLDNYEYAFPLLMKHRLSATFFVTVGLLERDPQVIELFQFFRQAGKEETEPITWQQAREMMKVGMELGSHTYSHVNLASLGRSKLEWELMQAKELMENRIGERVNGLAYPFGKPRRHFNASTLRIVQEVGYQYAVAVLSRGVLRRDSQWILPRFFVTNDDISMLSAKIKGTWDWLGYFQEFSPPWMARLISPEDSRV
jgi:peptidoglycan/xylan/chitin deacetylase (PgdA/CDA1 family)